MTDRKVRVRFAPSPTGALHIGGVRTALYNYLFAKQNGGDLILRIEDTDSQRFVPGAEAYIIEALTWLGIHFDEGVSFGGNYGPYRQSERREIYKKYVDQLLESGHAIPMGKQGNPSGRHPVCSTSRSLPVSTTGRDVQTVASCPPNRNSGKAKRATARLATTLPRGSHG